MAKRPSKNVGNDGQENTVRLNAAQVAEKARPIFADADKAENAVGQINTRWRDYAGTFVVPHLGMDVLENKDVKRDFRYGFYCQYMDAMGDWKAVGDGNTPITCLQDYQRYVSLNDAGKKAHPTSAEVKAAMNRAKVYFDRVLGYAKSIMTQGDAPDTRETRDIEKILLDTIRKGIRQAEKAVKKVPLGQESAKALSTWLTAGKMLDAMGTLQK